MAELTSTGLIIKRYPEILENIQNQLLQRISSQLSLTEDTILGQMIQILANELSINEEVVQSLNDSLDRDKAEGVSLDALLYLIGLERLSEANSSGFVSFVMQENGTVPIDTVATNISTGDRFRSTSSVTATQSNSLRTDYEVNYVGNELNYQITINGSTYSYTSDTDATSDEIVAGMVAAINGTSPTAFIASDYNDNGEHLLRIESTSTDTFSASSGIFLILPNSYVAFAPRTIKIRVPFEATEAGAIVVPEYGITNLLSGIGGVISLFNEQAFGVGRLTETDTEFRARATRSLSVAGGSTFAAMENDLANIEGASTVVLLENPSNAVDADGLPEHSFEAIVDIPDTPEFDAAVGNVIWSNKPMGVQSYGTQEVTILDGRGVQRTVYFSRPSSIFVAVRIEYTLNPEEVAPTDISTVIRNLVMDYISVYTAGRDVIPSKIASYVDNNVPSLESVVGFAQTLPSFGDPIVPANWSTSKIVIAPRETAVFNISSVETEDIT